MVTRSRPLHALIALCTLGAVLPVSVPARALAQTAAMLPPIAVSDPPDKPAFPIPVSSVQPEPARDLDQRVRDLEETLRQFREQSPNGSNGSMPTSQGENPSDLGSRGRNPPIPLESGSEESRGAGTSTSGPAGWDNGFFLSSKDGVYTLRITGQIQADLRDFLNDRDQTDISSFLVRRARLGIEATVFQYFEFRLLPDFGQSTPGVTYTPTIQDAYINVHYLDAIQFAAGKLKEPVSYEQLIQDRFVPTVERSLIDQLVPARDVGFMVHGYNLLGNKLDYALGVFNGEINGNADTNGFKDIAWRVAVRPLNFEELPAAVHLIQVGISGTTGVEIEPMNPAVLRTPLTVPFLTFNSGVLADGLRNRWSPELSYFYESLGFAAQLYYETQQMSPSAALSAKTIVTVPFNGYYVMATYLLTGEKRTEYSRAVVPLRPFEPWRPFVSPGAWELVLRYSRLDVGRDVFAPGPAQLADPTKNADRASELTVGYNWYLNAWVRMQFNWETAWFATPVPLGGNTPQGRMRMQDTIVARLQVIF
jgi:phosphate-selective porin OprO and OprP